jgi:hypothetical protein
MTEKMLLQEQCDSFTSKMRNKNHEATKLPCHYPDSLSLSSLSPALPSVSPTFPSPFSTAEKKNHSTIIKLSLRANFSLTEAKLNPTRKFRLFFPLLFHLPTLYQLQAENNQWKSCS